MELESIALENTPATHVLYTLLFTGVTNAEFLHRQLLERNAAFEYAFIDGAVAVSRMQILAAAHRALTAELNGTLRTANVHSEVVNAMNPTNNISESYSRFGISAKSTFIVVCKFAPADAAAEISAHLAEHVQGTPQKLTDDNLLSVTDWKKVNKYYKLNGLQWLTKVEEAERTKKARALVVAAMAVKGV